MLSRVFKYIDYDGNEREETHYFNLNKAETIQWMTTTGEYTLDKLLLRLGEERNGKRIMEIFEDLIRRSYGVKSLDGRRFEKSEELWKSFKETEAYSDLFSELVTDAKKASAFVNAIIPSDIAKEVGKTLIENKDGVPAGLRDYIPDVIESNPSSAT